MQILLWGSTGILWILVLSVLLDAKFNMILARWLARRYYIKTGMQRFRHELNSRSFALAEDLTQELSKLSSSSVRQLCREVGAE